MTTTPCIYCHGTGYVTYHERHPAGGGGTNTTKPCHACVSVMPDYQYPKVFRQFIGYAKTHELKVLHDEGLYRHLRFRSPGTSIGSFDLITVPGRLFIEGDLGGGWSFTREEDMLPWFNNGLDRAGQINPGYWWEKMPEQLRRAGKGYSEDAFRAYVASLINDTVESLGLNPDQRAALERDVEDDVLDLAYSRDEALAALRDFTHGYGLPDGRYANLTDMTEPGGWEDFDHHFLLACHAIHYGAGRYAREVRMPRLGKVPS